jgi:transcriptional regulator with XRE-family HTH domain
MASEQDPDMRGDVRAQIREFLSTRRARVTPQQAGLPVFDTGRRRVPGLRREEVAMLAGISAEYYVRLERGDAAGISEGVVDGIVHALQLDEAERGHLTDLLRVASTNKVPRRRAGVHRVRPTVQRLMDSMVGVPAFVLNGRRDLLAANELGRALYAPIYTELTDPPNAARFTFLNPRATEFFPDWNTVANDTVAGLRTEVGRDPYDRSLSDLIGELSTRSEDFRVHWANHNVRQHINGRKLIHHPTVGDLDLPFEFLPLPGDPDQNLLTYLAEPGSRAQEALDLLASWTTATREHELKRNRAEASPPAPSP